MELDPYTCKEYLQAHGYVVLKEKSYKAAQRRQEQAQSDLLWIERELASKHAWALDGHNEAQRLRDRLTFVYGVAKAKGATDEELHGCEQCRADTAAPASTYWLSHLPGGVGPDGRQQPGSATGANSTAGTGEDEK